MSNLTARRYRAPWLKSPGKDKFKQAGLAYLFAGILVISFTFLTELVPQNRAAAALLLPPGILFVVLFAVLLYLGPSARQVSLSRYPRLSRFLSAAISTTPRWAARLFAITNAGRTALILSNALGENLHLTFSPPRLFVVSSDPEPLFLVNVALLALIAFMLARAGWDLPPGNLRPKGVPGEASGEFLDRRGVGHQRFGGPMLVSRDPGATSRRGFLVKGNPAEAPPTGAMLRDSTGEVHRPDAILWAKPVADARYRSRTRTPCVVATESA